MWYGGGPAISVVGPPVEDTRRWTVHVYERAPEGGDGESLVELVAKLEHPEDLIQKESKDGKESRVAVKLQGRRPSMAELTFLAKTADFYDGEGDKAERGLSAVDSDEEAEDDDDEDDDDDDDIGHVPRADSDSNSASASFAPLTAAHLELMSGDDESDDSENVHSTSHTAGRQNMEVKQDADQIPQEKLTPSKEAEKPAVKRTSIFARKK